MNFDDFMGLNDIFNEFLQKKLVWPLPVQTFVRFSLAYRFKILPPLKFWFSSSIMLSYLKEKLKKALKIIPGRLKSIKRAFVLLSGHFKDFIYVKRKTSPHLIPFPLQSTKIFIQKTIRSKLQWKVQSPNQEISETNDTSA